MHLPAERRPASSQGHRATSSPGGARPRKHKQKPRTEGTTSSPLSARHVMRAARSPGTVSAAPVQHSPWHLPHTGGERRGGGEHGVVHFRRGGSATNPGAACCAHGAKESAHLLPNASAVGRIARRPQALGTQPRHSKEKIGHQWRGDLVWSRCDRVTRSSTVTVSACICLSLCPSSPPSPSPCCASPCLCRRTPLSYHPSCRC